MKTNLPPVARARCRLKPAFQGALFALGILALTLEPLVPRAHALDIQPLPLETSSASGYNYRAVITYKDLTNAAGAIQTLQLLPASGNLSTGVVVSAVAFNVSQQFTNTTANNTNLLLYIGFSGGFTNQFFNGVDIDVRTLQALGVAWFAATNNVFVTTTNTLNLQAVLKEAGGTPVLSTITSGKLEIYFRAFDLNKFENQ